MKKRTTKALILVLTIALIMGTLMIPASAAAQDFNAFPFQDGVMLTWTSDGVWWCEIAMFEEELEEPVDSAKLNELKHNLNRVNNNACTSGAFINESSTFQNNAITFQNTPGKTYYFYIQACLNPYSGVWACDKIVYTVPDDPTLEVSSEGLTNTLTYTLANNGNGGVIYRYDSQEKAEAGGNDYDKKFDVAYGGAAVEDTIDAEGSYYYVLKQDKAQAFAPAGGVSSNNGATNVKMEMDLTGATLTFDQPEGAEWTIMDVFTYDVDTSQNASTGYKQVSQRLDHGLEGISHPGGGLFTSCRFTFGGTTPLEVLENGKLMPGQTYTIQLTSHLGNSVFAASHITFTVPMLSSSAVQAAENKNPEQPTEQPTIDSTINPTINPTVNPTEKPTDPADPPTSTADLSVMIYVVVVFAAIAAATIFAIRKRNCKQN